MQAIMALCEERIQSLERLAKTLATGRADCQTLCRLGACIYLCTAN